MLYECCRVVKGHTKSIIYDLQRKTNRFIPNDLALIIETHNRRKISDILAFYSEEHHSILLENISILIDEEYLFLTYTPERFPSMSLQWDEPCQISNSILEFGSWMKSENVQDILLQLSHLGCRHVELRVYETLTIQELLSLLNSFHNLDFKSLDFFLNCPSDLSINEFKLLLAKYTYLHTVTIFNCENSEFHEIGHSGFGTLKLTQRTLDSRLHCGIVSQNNFVVNIKLFTESISYGNCLNRKISIDKEGNIKNCPSMLKSYGNIIDTSLREVVEKSEFKSYWGINKDKIHVCSDCEFRYMCHDCRAYLEDPEDILSKPLKCGYNPYEGEWDEWSTNPLKQKAIDFYGMRDMVQDINQYDFYL